jgi:hypothetical protein
MRLPSDMSNSFPPPLFFSPLSLSRMSGHSECGVRVYSAICALLPLTTEEQRADLIIELMRFRGWNISCRARFLEDSPPANNGSGHSSDNQPDSQSSGLIIGTERFVARVLVEANAKDLSMRSSDTANDTDPPRSWQIYKTEPREDLFERQVKKRRMETEKEKEELSPAPTEPGPQQLQELPQARESAVESLASQTEIN